MPQLRDDMPLVGLSRERLIRWLFRYNVRRWVREGELKYLGVFPCDGRLR